MPGVIIVRDEMADIQGGEHQVKARKIHKKMPNDSKGSIWSEIPTSLGTPTISDYNIDWKSALHRWRQFRVTC